MKVDRIIIAILFIGIVTLTPLIQWIVESCHLTIEPWHMIATRAGVGICTYVSGRYALSGLLADTEFGKKQKGIGKRKVIPARIVAGAVIIGIAWFTVLTSIIAGLIIPENTTQQFLIWSVDIHALFTRILVTLFTIAGVFIIRSGTKREIAPQVTQFPLKYEEEEIEYES